MILSLTNKLVAPTYFIQSGLVETSLVCRFYSLHADPI